MSKVRQLIREHQLAAAVPTPGAGQQVPAELVMDGVIVKGVPGLLTLFADGGWDDREILTWLFTADDSLPGRPIDALRENRGAEVKRRAQALALYARLRPCAGWPRSARPSSTTRAWSVTSAAARAFSDR